MTVTLTRGEWRVVKRVLEVNGFVGKPAVLRAVQFALEPVPAPDVATFVPVPGKPKGDGWPALKSSQDVEPQGH